MNYRSSNSEFKIHNSKLPKFGAAQAAVIDPVAEVGGAGDPEVAAGALVGKGAGAWAGAGVLWGLDYVLELLAGGSAEHAGRPHFPVVHDQTQGHPRRDQMTLGEVVEHMLGY